MIIDSCCLRSSILCSLYIVQLGALLLQMYTLNDIGENVFQLQVMLRKFQ